MPCYKPLQAFRARAGRNRETGGWPLVFKRTEGYTDKEVQIPCGRCTGCRLERSRVWAMRCMHESSLHVKNCFLTLTYSDENMPPDWSLRPEDMTKFLKRFRKKYGKIKYYQAGEYGDTTLRPHHHAIVFGFDFDDKKYHSRSSGFNLFTSKKLERLWPFGHSLIGGVTFESCAYVARYIMKKSLGKDSELDYMDVCPMTGLILNERRPEYATMSQGIGKDWFKKFQSDIYKEGSEGTVFARGGIASKPPRYYEDLFANSKEHADDNVNSRRLGTIKIRRKIKAEKNWKDNTIERLRVKEEVKDASIKLLKREI